MQTVLTSVSGYVISALTISGLIVLIALGKATFAEAGPLIAALAGGHLVAGATTTTDTTSPAPVAPPAA